MDVSTTFGTSFSQIINGTGSGTVYTVPANKCVMIAVSQEDITLTIGGDGTGGYTASYELKLSMAGATVQLRSSTYSFSDGGTSKVFGQTLTGFASAGQTVNIGYTMSNSAGATTGGGAIRYQIIEFNVVTT